MISIDTNLLLHAYNVDSPLHESAYNWLSSLQSIEDIAISEFVLAEFYGLLRNPIVNRNPLSAKEAADVIQTYRKHPLWRLIGFPQESRNVHDLLWNQASHSSFAFSRIYDVRTALTMIAQGVTEFATLNQKDFQGLGFQRVWNPLA